MVEKGRSNRGRPKKSSNKFKGKDNTERKSRSNDVAKGSKRSYSSKSSTDKKGFKKPAKTPANVDDKIRLNRYIASAGICSRREADEYIKAGVVTVNGKVVTELGTKVSISDQVRFNDKAINAEKPVYILLNKPKDYVTTLEDPHAKKTVIDLIKGACKERVFPVGRLDKGTTGVLLLTNDGDLTSKLTHPRYKRMKIYHVHLDKNLKPSDFEKILKGLVLDDGPVVVDSIDYVDRDDRKQLGIEIHSGRNRIVRRMFEHLGYRVRKLDRVYFAGLTKKGLPRGKWRFLSDGEINMLKIGAFK